MIGAATFYGGHHTVWQHAHFEFGLENVSRQFVWSFLHAHPFYNSEQQSQRYVRLDRAVAFVPAGGPGFGAAERAIYERAIARAWAYYRELTALLLPDAREILGDIWHVGKLSHPRRVKKVEGQADKRAIEVARYVLARRGGDDDGAHAFRHRAPPPVANAGCFRYAGGIARSRGRNGRARARA